MAGKIADSTKLLTPPQILDEAVVKHSLDDLFNNARRYRSGNSYQELMKFVSRFRLYSPYNAMLLHVQMPGAEFVAPASRWREQYGRIIKPTARPLVILQPMGPVMFVFDVSDTELDRTQKAILLPKAVEKPFDGLSGVVGSAYERTIENAKRDGVKIATCKEGSQSAGSIMVQDPKTSEKIPFLIAKNKAGGKIFTQIPIRYYILVNENMSREGQYATITHELAHLYCGHLGSPNTKWWPDRRGLGKTSRELEAESVAYLICTRHGIIPPSTSYLSDYISGSEELPDISIESILKATGLIEKMGKDRLKLRKEKE
ncbi:MAG: ImmA/IrrE family metallo-endopeptidase [Deltaproteobacteria bacterium]|nr:ImmA/IrrE family metallo-endopeptidase [Deltaproteobacteria bacterium]